MRLLLLIWGWSRGGGSLSSEAQLRACPGSALGLLLVAHAQNTSTGRHSCQMPAPPQVCVKDYSKVLNLCFHKKSLKAQGIV